MYPKLTLYRGYVSTTQCKVYGHFMRTPNKNEHVLNTGKWRYFVTVLNMFRIQPVRNTEIKLRFEGEHFTTKTLKDGSFTFILPFSKELSAGWHTCSVHARLDKKDYVTQGEVLKPYPSKYGIISDIDDTFLISHSGSFFKKLKVMLFRNVHRRKLFDGVDTHYRALNRAGQATDKASNAFFYVSSSEWNLYPMIEEFRQLHELPKAIMKLKDIKPGLLSFLSSGRGNHDHKYQKIKTIISFYPELAYILLGDDSQQDPFLYERVVKTFPHSVKAIYIRQTGNAPKAQVKEVLTNITNLNVETLYFTSSDKAIEHSKAIGII